MSMLLAATQAIRYGSRKSLSRLEDTEDYTSMSSSDEFQSPFHSLKKVMDTTSRAIDDAGLAGASPLKIKINLPTTVNYSIKAFKNDLKESLTQSHKVTQKKCPVYLYGLSRFRTVYRRTSFTLVTCVILMRVAIQ